MTYLIPKPFALLWWTFLHPYKNSLSHRRGLYTLYSGMVNAECVSVTGNHASRIWTIWNFKISDRICAQKEHTDGASVYDRLVGLVVRRPPRERKVPGSNPACAGIFPGSSHTSDLKTGTPVATLPGAWRYRVSTGTGRPGVSILWLGEVERLICNFYLSVAARKIVWADPSLRYTRMLLGR